MSDRMKLVPAELNDSKKLWEWRNHPEVRKNFFDSGEISLAEHNKWFEKKLKEKRSRIYMAVLEDKKIGVIRFEPDGDDFKVSVNLDPEYFGKGLGTVVVREGTAEFLKDAGKGRSVTARIKKDNLPSQKAFIRAGYVVKEQNDGEFICVFKNARSLTDA